MFSASIVVLSATQMISRTGRAHLLGCGTVWQTPKLQRLNPQFTVTILARLEADLFPIAHFFNKLKSQLK